MRVFIKESKMEKPRVIPCMCRTDREKMWFAVNREGDGKPVNMPFDRIIETSEVLWPEMEII